jgi:hypothetical protein
MSSSLTKTQKKHLRRNRQRETKRQQVQAEKTRLDDLAELATIELYQTRREGDVLDKARLERITAHRKAYNHTEMSLPFQDAVNTAMLEMKSWEWFSVQDLVDQMIVDCGIKEANAALYSLLNEGKVNKRFAGYAQGVLWNHAVEFDSDFDSE